MAMDAGDARDGTGLAGLIATKMDELTKGEFDVKKGYHMLDAIAQAVVEHIAAEAEISTTGTASDVTPGAGTAPVESTGTIS